MGDTIIERCGAKGVRMTDQSRTTASLLEDADDHPDVEELYARASTGDPRIPLATVYRTNNFIDVSSPMKKLAFGDRRALYEDAERDHQDLLVDLQSGEVIAFVTSEIEAHQERIAARPGYELGGHKLELYGAPKPLVRK